MKQIIYSFLILILFSCSGGDSENNSILNSAPEVPTLVYPTHNLLCIDHQINFQWNASLDGENDQVSYIIEIATDNTFTQIVKNETVNGIAKQYELEKDQAYYWRVYAKDNLGNKSSFSDIYSLYTEGETIVNHLPYLATLVYPNNNAIITDRSILLKWTGEDVDNDSLTFDVFYGEDTNLTKIASQLNINEFSVNLEPTKTYFWRVDVVDSKNGKTIGKTWKFETE